MEPEERGKVSAKRLRRFATFGAFDGVLSHYWYRWLDDAADAWPTFGEISGDGAFERLSRDSSSSNRRRAPSTRTR